MYLRFTIGQPHAESRQQKGLFAAAYDLLESGDLAPESWSRIRAILDWFNDNLEGPPEDFSKDRAVFWFKAWRKEAKPCIERIWELVNLVREHGYLVYIHRCDRLGNICWQDQFQVAAYPSDKDGRIVVR